MSVVIRPQTIAIKMDTAHTAPQLELESFNTQTSSYTSAPVPDHTNTTPPPPFPILSLPPELIHQIASNYYALLPPLTITQSNHHLPHHALTPFALSSPHLLSILPPSVYYAHAIFLFSSPSLLKPFAETFNRATQVRRIKIWHGALGPLGPGTGNCSGGGGERGSGIGNGRCDWVFSFLEAFRGVEEVTFVIELGMSEGFCERSRHVRVMEGWWECVRDAVREGWGARSVGEGKGKELTLRVECDGFEGCWVDRICG